MPKLIIDNLEIEVPEGTKVIEAAERLGIMIPRFCYHPGLGSFGACLVCAVVFLEGPVKGVDMSCMVAAKDGMVVSTTHPEAVEFRRYVIEWLMLHHPHDCPVCDEGGHCLLQDETVSGGHGLRRYLGPKRTYHDQYLGAFVQHEMNRCIQCWRCRNFYQGFAGYRDYGAMQIANRTYFGRFTDGPLESPFSGNIIDLCPTGVLTDKPARFKGRRWHFERGPTLCLHCSLGCNLTGSALNRELVRQEGRFNDKVNGYFICDRGRFGFYYESHPERPRRARLERQEVPWQEAVQAAAARLTGVLAKSGPDAIAALGSPRSSLETQAGLLRFCRTLGWPAPHYFPDPALSRKVARAVRRLDERLAVSLRELEGADFLLAVGADPVNEAPMLALALRQAYRRGAGVALLDPRPIFLPCESVHLPVAPRNLELYFQVLIKRALGDSPPEGLSPQGAGFYESLPGQLPGDPQIQERLAYLAQKLAQSRNPVIICGTDIVGQSTPDLAADCALLLQAAGKQARLFYLLPGPNAFGAGLMGFGGGGQGPEAHLQSSPKPPPPTPYRGLGGELEGRAGDLRSPGPFLSPSLLDAIEGRGVKALVVVESDPFWHYPDRQRLVEALDRLELLLVLDYLPSPLVQRAQIVLPTLTLFERVGSSFVNQEGRVQWVPPLHHGGVPMAQISPDRHPPRDFLNYVPGSDPRPAGEILAELAAAMGREMPQGDPWGWLAEQNPVFGELASLPEQPFGLRLIPGKQAADDFTVTAATPEEAPGGAFELLLVDWTFGTEELAAYSRYIRQVEQPPVMLMHPGDADSLGHGDGDRVAVELAGGRLEVQLKLDAGLAPGILVLPRHRLLDWQQVPESPVLVPRDRLKKI
jgi:NADH-quinone oxidoreductase subunit G